jgi:hypothetical protein
MINKPSLFDDLRLLHSKSYSPDEQIVLKYALSLSEILIGTRTITWSFEEFVKLPGALELDEGHIAPKLWPRNLVLVWPHS